MTEKEQLYYLINGVLDGSYQVKTFCSEFTRVGPMSRFSTS